MQVHTTAKNMSRIFRMDCDCISVRNLTFSLEMTTTDGSPRLTRISAAEDTQQPIAQAVLSKSVNHVRVRWTDRKACAAKIFRSKQTLLQLPPVFAAIVRQPNST